MRLQSCRLGYRLVKLQESIFILPYLPRYVSMFPSSRCSHPHLCIPNQAMGNNNKLSKAKRPLSPSYVLPKPSSIQPLPSQTKLFPTPSINQSIQRLSKSKVQNSFKSARHLASHHTPREIPSAYTHAIPCFLPLIRQHPHTPGLQSANHVPRDTPSNLDYPSFKGVKELIGVLTAAQSACMQIVSGLLTHWM